MNDQPLQPVESERVAHEGARHGDARYREAARVTIIGAVLDLVLGIAKLVVGFLAHSQALIADGVHSLSDLATDGMVLYAARHGSREPDTEHPYGHGRFETVATVGLAVALVLVAGGIAWDAAARLFHPDRLLHPGIPALIVAALSIAGKEWIYHYTMRVARRQRSDLLRANAWHSRTDAMSSVIVVVGVAGTMAGLDYLDAIAAVGVALMVAHIGWRLGWNAVKELVDTAVDERQVSELRERIMDVGGVRDLHLLRTRRAGGQVLVDVHVIVDGALSVSEGHHIGDMVRQRLLEEFEGVTDVTVHIDPEDDERHPGSSGLPARSEMVRRIRRQLVGIDEAGGIERFTLHYLGGKVRVELLMRLAEDATHERCREVERRFQQAVADDPLIDSLEVHWR